MSANEIGILALVALACVGWTLALTRRGPAALSDDGGDSNLPAAVGARSDGCVTLNVGSSGFWMSRAQADWLGLQLMLAAHATGPDAPRPETSTARHSSV